MKKLFLVVMLCVMSYASNSLFAQNEKVVIDELSQAADTSLISEQAVAAESEGTSGPEAKVLPLNDLESVVAVLNNTTGGAQQNILGTDKDVFVPIHKHGKINGHHICQRLELSVLADKSETSKDLANKLFGGALFPTNGSADDQVMEKLDNKTGGLGVGANFGYSLVFIPGYRQEEGDQLLLNRFGFGYSVGFISQFDHEKNAGISCDFLGKVGVETGFNKAIGVGMDALFGGGKTNQTVLDFSDVDENNPNTEDLDILTESLWCGKVGTQLWLRLNFLTESVKNFDTSLFSRFVYSIRPYSDKDELNRMTVYNELPFWQHEAWTFGFVMTYFF